MSWSVLIPIIAQYGVPLAESLWQKWTSGKDPTQADWDQLKTLVGQTSSDRMKAALVANNIALDSDLAKQLLALSD